MENTLMKSAAIEMALNHWPYGLEVQPSAKGLLLRPRRKARAQWTKGFRHPRSAKDDLASTRQFNNNFDVKKWEW
jgi:hypothetical protein